MREQNLDIIHQRWPQVAERLENASIPHHHEITHQTPETTLVIDGIHLTSAYDRQAEASFQAQAIPLNSRQAWVYGMGLGDLPRRLLQREQIKELKVVILNPAVALASLTFFDHEDWLRDARTELQLGNQAYPSQPLVANPASLILADTESAALRDRVFMELSSAFVSQRHDAGNDEVQQAIAANLPLIEQDGDVSSLFHSKDQGTILVAAAGPSLSRQLDRIRQHRDLHPIVAVNSALKPLAQAGITPDVALVVDPDPKIMASFQGFDLSLFENIPLVYFPRVPKAVLEYWPGPRLTAYSKHPCYAPLGQTHPKGELFASGSALHSAVDLGVKMGAASIILFGADLAFPGGQQYAEGAGWGETDAGGAKHWVLDGHGNRIETTPAFRSYLRDLETYISHQPKVRFFNSSLDGAHIQGTHLWEGTP
jgi:hypothetical protein